MWGCHNRVLNTAIAGLAASKLIRVLRWLVLLTVFMVRQFSSYVSGVQANGLRPTGERGEKVLGMDHGKRRGGPMGD